MSLTREVVRTKPGMTRLRLRTAHGPVYRDVSIKPARECDPSEIPVIDLSGMTEDPEARRRIAKEVAQASKNNGFFYIKNHGIEKEKIQRAREAALQFFKQPSEMKSKVRREGSRYLHNGWTAPRSYRVNPDESIDLKESFGWSYSPDFDPAHEPDTMIPPEISEHLHYESRIWDGTSHLPDFKKHTIAYWQECLSLARQLVRIFALALDLPEDHFDSLTTYPGADGLYNLYPRLDAEQLSKPIRDVGLGSHTDLQCFTLLWQDSNGGLQVLNKDAEWIWATPIEDTLVVNIGDFLQRLTNDRFRSTVHRAYNKGLEPEDRLSMPFFFGFNFNERCEVLPSCIDEDHPAKYEPISCGEWCQLRFAQAVADAKRSEAERD